MTREKIVLYENLRACSYTPFYLAQLTGAFDEAGLDVDLRLSPSTPETAQGLIDGRADVSFGGPMRVMLHHDAAKAEGEDCPLVCFAQVVAGDPFILVGREPNPDFQFKHLYGPRVAVATDVPTPWMTLYDDLDREGLDPSALTRTPDGSMLENTEAFERGEVDVIQVFEPYADRLVSGGHGHVWHRFSVRGDIAFTSFYTTRRFASEHRPACKALTKAIATSLDRLHAMPAAEIAGLVGPKFFPDLPEASYTRIIQGYRDAGLWPRTPALPVAAFARLKSALLSGGLISYDVPYDLAVDAELSEV
jgi:NitT/TauT family transport system substrate-binding protein